MYRRPATKPCTMQVRFQIALSVRVPAPLHLDARALDLREQIAALPPTSGIYALHASDKPPHISWSANLRKRLARLLVSSYTGCRSLIGQLRYALQAVECWPSGSKLETSLLMYCLTKAYFPGDYLFRLRLRMPWLVGLTESDAFPRLTVANRIPRKCGVQFGPFPSRDTAQHYQEQVLGLFQIRRCPDVLVPTPDHPGCIYGEMNRCLLPCQCAVTAQEYASEVRRVADFLSTNGKRPIAILSAARDRAADQTDFEEAAHIHKRIENMSEAAALRPQVITEIHGFNGVALTQGVQPRNFRLWPMFAGFWQEPLTLDFSAETGRAQSLDRDIREQLQQALVTPLANGERAEDLAIFSRWYYSSWRDGQWFPFRTLADLNYRRLVREISSLVKKSSAPE
jgi:excinuclease ABC subunit C